MEYAEQQETNRDVQNKNPVYIENHETLPPLLWAVTRSVKAREN